tara:strand:+ start:58 stop:327 length:270 start_codon:yes stop_codon:yes gene_type:complete
MGIEEIKKAVGDLPKDKLQDLKKEFYLESKTKGVLDGLQEKIISRKLLVFATATALLVYSGLDAETWGMIAMMYIGGQSAIDFAKIWKG